MVEVSYKFIVFTGFRVKVTVEDGVIEKVQLVLLVRVTLLTRRWRCHIATRKCICNIIKTKL